MPLKNYKLSFVKQTYTNTYKLCVYVFTKMHLMRNKKQNEFSSLFAVSGQPQIVRTCFFGEIANTQSGCSPDPSVPFVKQLSCDVCAGDMCNGSSTMAPIALTILAFFALARIFS